MRYIKGESREQITLLPASIEDYVEQDNPVRLIDQFVEGLDMEKQGYERAVPKADGRPGYDPRDLLKLYIYAYLNGIRSSRKIETETQRNIELMWLLRKLTPDFKTIAEFRRKNAECIKKTFCEFLGLMDEMKLLSHHLVAIDGSKVKAYNNPSKNVTKNVLAKRLKQTAEKIEEYLGELEKADEQEAQEDTGEKERKQTKKNLRKSIKKLEQKQEKDRTRQKQMEDSGQTQLSYTDKESRMMKTRNGMKVCLNVQTAVEAKNHCIVYYAVTNDATDNKQLSATLQGAKKALSQQHLQAVADKGYQSEKELLTCLCRGDMVHLFPPKGKEEHILHLPYLANQNTDKTSHDPKEIRACLQAGILPECLEDKHIKLEIKNDGQTKDILQTEEQEIAPLLHFERDLEKDIVICPQGQILRFTKIEKRPNGMRKRYENSSACKACKNKCTDANSRDVGMSEGQTISYCYYLRKKQNQYGGGGKKQRVSEYVQIRVKPIQDILNQRGSLVEHPYGTIKHAWGMGHLLLKGCTKASADIGLACLAYNIRRAINLVGVPELLEYLRECNLLDYFCEIAKPHLSFNKIYHSACF